MAQSIAVIGGGHAGHGMAADLTLAGHNVIFCAHPGPAAAFQETLRRGRIEITGHARTGVAAPRAMTTDVGEALGAARLVQVLVPAMRQPALFDALAPHLRDEHQVVFWSGYLGSLRLAARLRTLRGPHPLIGEASTVPYSVRLLGPARVHVQAVAASVLLAALPGERTAELLAACAPLWPGVIQPARHVLQAAFSNPNLLAHTAPVLLNLGRIEHTAGDFYLYREGITPAVARVMIALHHEIGRVAAAYGFQPRQFQEGEFAPPASVVEAVFAGPESRAELGRSRGPSGVQHRYLTEDLPYGLAPIARLARLAGVATPLLDGLLAIGSAAAGRDFHREGPDLEALGLAGLDVPGVIACLGED